MKNTFISYQPDGCELTILLTSKKEVNVNSVIKVIINELVLRRYVVSTKVTESNKKISGFGKNRNFCSSMEFVINNEFTYITDRDINSIKKKCKLSYVGIHIKPHYKKVIHEIF